MAPWLPPMIFSTSSECREINCDQRLSPRARVSEVVEHFHHDREHLHHGLTALERFVASG
jgi:hypothetical protein